jgi:hypothetical protein
MGNAVASNNKGGVNVANTIMWQLRAPTNRLWVYEIGLSVSTAPTTGPSWQLIRSATVGTNAGGTNTMLGEKEDPGGATITGTLDNAWTGTPTIGTNFMRRYATSNGIGAGIVWTWTTPLAIPAAGGLAIVNGTATGTTAGNFNIYVVWSE